jgi:small conductance mechanosensitive channel
MKLDLSLAAERFHQLTQAFVTNLPNYLLALATFLVLLLAGTFAARQIRRALARTGAPYGLQSLLGSLARIGLAAVGLMLALGILGVDAAAIVAGAGVAGLVLGIAFKDILENFMAGILLLLRQPFTVGDRILTNGIEGTVTEINLRATVLKTYDGEEARVPNGAVLRSPVLIKTAYPLVRTVLELRVPYSEDLGRTVQVVEGAVRGVAGVAGEPAPEVAVVDYREGAMTLQARFWTDSSGAVANRLGIQVRLRVKEALDRAGIELAVPRTLLLHGAGASGSAGAAEEADLQRT